MTRISIKAIVIAFAAELIADGLIGTIVFLVLARGTVTPDLDAEASKAATEAFFRSGEFLLASIVFGTATTVGGGYLAARLAKTYPYFNGLGIGVVGLVYGLFSWGAYPVWFSILALLITLPASIYGAHIARGHMPVE